MKDSERLRVGIVLERRRIASAWREHEWHAIAAVPGARDIAAPRLIAEGEGFSRYHFATLDIVLYRSETEGYRANLGQRAPVVYVLWRLPEEDPDATPELFHVTLCPYEAQDYLDGGDVVVEGVPMPEAVALWLNGYVARHHVETPFAKRRRKPHAGGEDLASAAEEDELG